MRSVKDRLALRVIEDAERNRQGGVRADRHRSDERATFDGVLQVWRKAPK